MNVEQNKRGLKVLRVFGGSPAEGAGIQKGDFILGVNGHSIAGVNSQVATSRIKGPAGTSVSLRVFTPGAERAVLLHEGVADRARQVGRVAAEPEADGERDDRAHECEDASRHSGGG